MVDKEKEAERAKLRKERELRAKVREERRKKRQATKKVRELQADNAEKEAKLKQKDEEIEKEKKKEDDKPFTIAGYTLGEILKAPVESPDEKEVGKRSPASDDS